MMELLKYSKSYLVEKSLESFRKSEKNNVDDITKYITKIEKSKDIDELKSNVSELKALGLSSLNRINIAIYQFCLYSNNKLTDIHDLDTNFILDFKQWLTIAESTKDGYIGAVLELAKHIETTEKISLSINSQIIRSPKKNEGVLYDTMGNEEFERFARDITKYNYQNELSKNQYVLMMRLILFSGITVKELLELELNKNLFIDDKDMYIRLKNRRADIDLPRTQLIQYFNKYKELSLKEKNYDVTSNPLFTIGQDQISKMIKTLLKFCNINRKPDTATMLRYSFFVYLWNNRDAKNGITFETIHEISGITNRKELEKILNTFDNKLVSLPSLFMSEKFTL